MHVYYSFTPKLEIPFTRSIQIFFFAILAIDHWVDVFLSEDRLLKVLWDPLRVQARWSDGFRRIRVGKNEEWRAIGQAYV